MARRHLTLAIFGFCFLAPSAVWASPQNPARDDFFKGTEVLALDIDLDQEGWESLLMDPRAYVGASIRERGKGGWREVWIHCRGSAGSFQGIDGGKPGFTISMKQTDAGSFHGMEKFHLHNSPQDPTYVQELLCGEVFRAAGVPASRIRHAVVTLNSRRLGLYYLKEGYDRQFLEDHFGESGGNLYDGGFLRDIDQPLQLLSTKNDVAGHGDLKALLAAAQEKDHEQRLRRLEQLLDMDRFLSLMALEVAMWDWDGYPMKPNNYRVYHEVHRNKITIIPSGMDQMFGDTNGTILPDMGGVVARALMETKQGRAWYVARLAELMDKVYQPRALARRLEQLQAQLQPALNAVDEGAGKDYANQMRYLRDRIRQRHVSIVEQLKQARPLEILPWFFEDRLHLTADQAKRLADLRQEFDGKLRKILDERQLKELKQLQASFGPGKWGDGLALGDLLAKDLLPVLDADRNGTISKDEFMKGADRLFAVCDTNKSGSLDEKKLSTTLDQLLTSRETAIKKEQLGFGPGTLLAIAILRRGDRNNDRKLTLDEWQKMAAELFQELDADQKGHLDAAALARGMSILIPTVSPRWPGARVSTN